MGRSLRFMPSLPLSLMGLLASCGSGASSPPAGNPDAGGADLTSIIAAYPAWQPVSAVPIDISNRLFGLCKGLTSAEKEFIASVHTRFALRDWVNQAAATGLDRHGAPRYPVDATIVKEKFRAPGTGAPLELAALGIMVKRAVGFDPSAGDWEFGYWDAVSGLSQGRAETSTCVSCHAGAVASDYVFEGTAW